MKEIIIREAARFDLDPLLVAAVIYQESKGECWSTRYEQGFYDDYIKGKSRDRLGGTWLPFSICSEETERSHRATSWGLMHVLGQTARELGFTDHLSRLILPEEGIHFGCMYLKKKSAGGVGKEKMLLGYNGGTNKSYPKKVLAHIDSGQAVRLLG